MIKDASFPILDQYANYMLAVLSRSELTVLEYRYDLITFFRFYKKDCKLAADDVSFDSIPIEDIDADLIGRIVTEDLFVYLIWLTREKNLSPASRARKVASLRSFFKYCCAKKHIISTNPAIDLDTPKLGKRNPKYLTLEQSTQLLNAASSSPTESNERDFCILTLFLNCGMRLAELRGIDIDDIHGTTLTVIGKGNKERTIYLNNACLTALSDWITARAQIKIKPQFKNALFISRRGTRLSDDMIQLTVKRLLSEAGIDTKIYSVHKLRHTAATLMYKYGHVDIRNLQAILGHKSISTTEIYTHVDEEQLQKAVDSNPLANFSPDN